MGLDMYAYVANKAGQMNEHYKNYDYDKDTSTVTKPREIAYWRKHPNLHGWMEQLWNRKGQPGFTDDSSHDPTFNGIELELTWEDLEDLERAVTHKQLPATSGFFFGDGADDHYSENDIAFIKNAKAELFLGLKVFYNSSW